MRLPIQRQLILFCFLIIAVAVTSIIFFNYRIVEMQTVPVNVTVMESIGINLDKDTLHFGGIPPGNCAGRNLWMQNTDVFPVRIHMTAEGQTAPWVTSSQLPVELAAGEKQNVGFSACVPADVEHGEYSGSVQIVVKHI